MTASGDTSVLYEKKMRSSAPSRKKVAGQMKGGHEIPKDAIPEVHIPGFIESMLGGPLVPQMKFLPPDKSVQQLQIYAYISVALLGVFTWIVNPASGTAWHWATVGIGAFLPQVIHLAFVVTAVALGAAGTMTRDTRMLLGSYVLFLLVGLRFASSQLDTQVIDLEQEIVLKLLVVIYAVLLVLFFELTSGVIRFSMLDTSIRTNEVYVLNVGKVRQRYLISLLVNPLVAGALAFFALLFNAIIPAVVDIFSDQAARRLRESVELTSVYGVALGTLLIFLVVGVAFAVNLPLRLQQFRDRGTE